MKNDSGIKTGQFGRPTWVEIDLGRIRDNYQVVRGLVPSTTKILCVVKDDAYGHGSVAVARVLQEEGAQWFALATLDEALELREAGIKGRMLVFGSVPVMGVPEAIAQNITLTIPHEDVAHELIEAASGKGLTVHLKVDTGMGRAGVLAESALEVLHHLNGLRGLNVEGIYSHFSCADSDESYSSMQLRRFEKLLHQSAVEGIRPAIAHFSNSAGILTMKTAMLDAVRPGLLLYGLSPIEGVPINGLRPAMSMKTRIVSLKQVPAGYGIGYGRSYLTYKTTVVGILPVGYADGYSRMLSNKASVLIHGKRAPVIGRIGMDQTTIDLSDIPDAKVGDEVILMGETANQRITAGDLGSLAQSISYEVLTTVGKLVRREYRDQAGRDAELSEMFLTSGR
ncbi:MAG: alanine racemase [Candidatus Cryosericum sp.]|nr:alanine racemase [bacterium]